MTKQIVIDRLKSYNELKQELTFKLKIAISLNFHEESTKIESDIQWCEEIIELINDIDSEK